MNNQRLFQITDHLVLTLWVGGMWMAGFVIAPLLFSELDRHTAGMVGGKMFAVISYIGLVCGSMLLVSAFYNEGKSALRQWRGRILVIMLVIVCIMEFVFAPMMADLKSQGLVEGSEIMKRFGQLHGIASAFYLINSLLGLILVIQSTKD